MGEIPTFPAELVQHMMSFMPLCLRKNCRLVSKNWHKWSYYQKLLQNDVTKVEHINDLLLASEHMNHIHLIIMNLDNPHENCRTFWQNHGSKLKSIELHNISDLNDPVLVEIFENCSNVEYITLSARLVKTIDRPELDVSGISMSKLLGLDVRQINDFDHPLIKALVADAVSLNTLSVKNSNGVIVNCNSIISLLQRQGRLMRELNIAASDLTVEFLRRLFSLREVGSNMKKLYIDVREICIFRGVFEQIANNFHNLEMVNLSKFAIGSVFYGSRDDQLEELLTALPNLKMISFRDRFCTPYGFLALKKFDGLKALDFSNSDMEGTAKELAELLASESCSLLEDLRLDRLNWVDERFLSQICPNLENLTCLSLAHCYYVTQDAMSFVFTHNIKLQRLNLNFCANIVSLTNCEPTINNLRNLKHLAVSNLSKNSIDQIELIDLETISLNRLVNYDLRVLFENCPSLHFLALDRDIDMEYISARTGKQIKFVNCEDGNENDCLVNFPPRV